MKQTVSGTLLSLNNVFNFFAADIEYLNTLEVSARHVSNCVFLCSYVGFYVFEACSPSANDC